MELTESKRQEIRADEIAVVLIQAGHAISKRRRGDEIRITVKGSRIAATVHSDGSVTRTWADGSKSRD